MNSLISIQLLRAVAAWFVVYSHYVQFISLHHLNKILWLGYMGVDIFFVISGFIMFYSLANKTYDAREFFVRRLIRVVPAYWFYTFLIMLFALVYTREFSYTNWNSGSLLASLFFIKSANPSGLGYYPLLTVGWTINYEIFFYALLGACIWAFGRFSFLACAAILIALPVFWDAQWSLGIFLSQNTLFAFAYGIALGHAYVRLKGARHHLLYVSGLVLFALALSLFLSEPLFEKSFQIGGDAKRPLLAFLIVGGALCFEPALLKIRSNAFGLLKYLGDISYSTYLSHTIVIGVFNHYIWELSSAPEELFWLLIVSLSIVAVSHLGYQYIETGHLVRMLKRRFLKEAPGLS